MTDYVVSLDHIKWDNKSNSNDKGYLLPSFWVRVVEASCIGEAEKLALTQLSAQYGKRVLHSVPKTRVL